MTDSLRTVASLDAHNFRFRFEGARLSWSAIGDFDDWTVDPDVTQCSYAEFGDTSGEIKNIRGYHSGLLVFKSDGAAYYGRYVGAGKYSPIWEFVRVDGGYGIAHFPAPSFAGQWDKNGRPLLWPWPKE